MILHPRIVRGKFLRRLYGPASRTCTVDCNRNRMWLRLQNQPVQILYWLVNQFVPPEDWNHTKPIWETRLWYNLIGEVVQSLYGLLFEQSSPSIPVAIDCM